MPTPKRSRISEWRAPQANTQPRNMRPELRRETLTSAEILESIQLLIERQMAVLDDIRNLNNNVHIPVPVRPSLSTSIKSADHALKHLQSAEVLAKLEAEQ